MSLGLTQYPMVANMHSNGELENPIIEQFMML